jgi:hypothetical protein
MPYFGPLPDTLFIGDTDIQKLQGIVVEDLAGLIAPGTRRGDNDIIPGRVGQVGVTKPLDAFAMRIPIAVLPFALNREVPYTAVTRRGMTLENLRRVTTLVAPGLVTLTRRISSTNAQGYADHTCAADYQTGITVNMLNFETGRTELEFVNLDGCWYDTVLRSASPGTVTVMGDVYTRRMMIDLPGAGTLTNATLGVSVTVTVPCTLNIERFSATAGISSLDHAGDDYWFALAPGPNTVTWSGDGTPAISYRAAYL